MGTRSLTIVKDSDNQPILTMYGQMDGYPTGHGQDLADLLKPYRIVHGIGMTREGEQIANGMGCLAGQIVSFFKQTVGGFYLYPTGTKDVGEEYAYVITGSETEQITLKVYSVNGEGKRKLLWSGKPGEYNGAEIEK